MLVFILAVLATLVSMVVDMLSDRKPRLPSMAWVQAPVTPQVMDTNIRIELAGDTYLFFPSDNVVFKHSYAVPATQRRVTLDMGKQNQAVFYVPQKRAIREQEARLKATKEPVCPRTPQDVNAAVLWMRDKLGERVPAEVPDGAAKDPGVPLRNLYKMHLIRDPALKNDTERKAAWDRIRHELARQPGTPVELTSLLGNRPDGTRFLARLGQHGRVVSLWSVVPMDHPVYKYRIELEQDTARRGVSITTAIFTTSDDIVPCLDLAERISAQANRVLADGSARMRLH